MLADELSDIEQLDEKMLLKKVAAGNYCAFTRLYNLYIAELTNYALKLTRDRQVVEDCLHDVFVWLWNNRSQVQIKYSLKAYLIKSVRTSLLRKMERNSRMIFSEEYFEHQNYDFNLSAEDQYIDAESSNIARNKIQNELARLTARQKEAIYLRFYQGLSFDEIAVHMNMSTKACYKLMGRAIADLRKSLLHGCLNPLFIFFLFFLHFVG